jgi:hypothetical protein
MTKASPNAAAAWGRASNGASARVIQSKLRVPCHDATINRVSDSEITVASTPLVTVTRSDCPNPGQSSTARNGSSDHATAPKAGI